MKNKTQSTVTKKKKVKVEVDVKKAVEQTFEIASTLFNKKGGISPMIFCDLSWVNEDIPEMAGLKEGKKGMALILDDESVNSRRQIIYRLGSAVALLEMLGVVGKPTMARMASEAWSSSNLDSYRMPSDDPERKEVLMVSATNRKLKTGTKIMSMKRRLFRKPKLVSIKGEVITYLADDKDSLLSSFWESYESVLKKVKKDKVYKQFLKESKKNPGMIFKMVMAHALDY